MSENELLTTTGKILVWLYRKGGKARLAEARKEFGSKIYYHLGKMALKHYIILNEHIELTEKGKKYAECLSFCFSEDTESKE